MNPKAKMLYDKHDKNWFAERVVELEEIMGVPFLELLADLKERTNQYHLAHAKILSREAIIEGLSEKLRVLRAMLDTAYHLRFVDDTSTHKEQMEFWKDVEKAIESES